MSTIELWLIRHAESSINAGVLSTAPHAVQLTGQGQQQANLLATQVTKQPDLIVVSPAERARQTAQPIIQRWPYAPVETWPIEELVYLPPEQYCHANAEQRQAMIANYWQHADPFLSAGSGAESFAHFVERLHTFYQHILKQHGFVIVIGHGEFFKAFQLGLKTGFFTTSDWMKKFRAIQINTVIQNAEIIKIWL